jgi:hypothetical protein
VPEINGHNHFIKVMFSICVVAAVLFIQSCDPARILIVKSSNKPNSSVEIYANKNLQALANANGKENGQAVIKIPTNEIPVKRDTAFYFGFGGWREDESISQFSRTIDSIIIQSNNGKVVLNKQEEINSYLLKHRRGLFKQVLTIKAK